MRGRDRICAQAQAEFLLKSICIHILHQIIFVTLTRIEGVKKKKKQTKENKKQNINVSFVKPWLGNSGNVWVRGHIQIKT